MHSLLQDLRYGVRMLAKSPGVTAVAALTLALGIGANTTIFSLLNEVAWRTLPGAKEPDRLVWVKNRNLLFSSVSYPDYLDYWNENKVFSGLLAGRGTPLDWRGPEGSERLQGAIVSENYFAVLGVRAPLGRTFLPEEKDPVAVVSYAFWKRRFGGDPGLVGRPLILNGHGYTVVGIAPADFRPTDWFAAIQVWLPMAAWVKAVPQHPDVPHERGSAWFSVMGRLKAGASTQQAEAELKVLGHGLDQAYPARNWTRQMAVAPATGLSTLSNEDLNLFGVLLAAVVLVLLIACSNVANLLLARAAGRRREIAVRLAVGAGRGRLVRQLLTESLLLSLLGGAMGLLLARWSARLVLLMLPAEWDVDVALDHRVLGFTVAVSLLTALVFGLAPALQASGTDLVEALKEGGGAGTPRSGARTALVVAQLAASLVLLIGAGLFARTLRNFHAIDLGFRADRLLFFSVDLGLRGYPEARGKLFYRELVERVAGLPGVEAASLAREMPLGAHGRKKILVEGRGQPEEVDSNNVAPGYFATVGIPQIEGREFSSRDGPGAPGVVIVNAAMARHFWPGDRALGKRLCQAAFGQGPWLEVVGVVKDSKYRKLAEAPRPLLYLPVAQHYEPEMILHVRAAGKPRSLITAVEREVQSLDRDLPVFDVGTFADHLNGELLDQRILATLVSVFAGLAMVLASVGIYGVISYAVSQRTHEIGVRMALGAGAGDVLKLVVRRGAALAMAGVAIGSAAAWALTRLVSSRLYGVSPTDPPTFLAAAALLAAVALVASYIPARRAAKMNPLAALRYE